MRYYPKEIDNELGSRFIAQDELDSKYYGTTNYFKAIGFNEEQEAKDFIDNILAKRDYIHHTEDIYGKGVIGYEIEYLK